MLNDETTGWLELVQLESGKIAVRDTRNGKFVRYSYSTPPSYGKSDIPPSIWQNFYAARGFAQKLYAKNVKEFGK